MIRIILFSTLVLMFFSGCSKGRENTASQRSVVATTNANELFCFTDSQFDDRGTGRYIYPANLQGQREGIFDMKSFAVRDLGSTVEFTIEFRRPIDKKRLDDVTFQKSWAYQLIDIYIDTDRGQSGQSFGLPGRNIEFNVDEAWNKVIVLMPGFADQAADFFVSHSELRDFYLIRKDIIIPNDVYTKTFSIVARVSKSELGQPNDNWGYQVCVLGFDPQNLKLNGFYNMEVNTFPTDETFGGGTDYEGNPNVIDILSPDKEAQYRVLSAFRSGPYANDNLYAIIPMIYQKDKQKVEKNRIKSSYAEEIDRHIPVQPMQPAPNQRTYHGIIEERYRRPIED